MKGKTTFLFLIAFVLTFALLAAAQGGGGGKGAAPNGFGGGFGGGGGGGFGGGFGGGGGGKGGAGGGNNGDGKNNGGDGKNVGGNDGKNVGGNDGKNNGGGGNDDKANICNNGKFDLGDGTQQADKSTCITTQMGQLPTTNNMVSSVILSPQDRSTLKANTPFQFAVAIANMETGFFSDAETQYYTESQTLNAQGIIQGHSHVTIQKMQANQNQPADARDFAFFQGLNDPAKNGVLSTTVDGLEPGLYRACTMASSFTHQSVLMPVAKRGAQDDCIRFTVK